MAVYIRKPNPVNAFPYSSGQEDGTEKFTSETVNYKPIPPDLQNIALNYVKGLPNGEWEVAIPYLAGPNDTKLFLKPTDYIIIGETKSKRSKTDFEQDYEPEEETKKK